MDDLAQEKKLFWIVTIPVGAFVLLSLACLFG